MTFTVIACSNCTRHWVATDDNVANPKTTTECPACGTRHTGTHRVLATTLTHFTGCNIGKNPLDQKIGDGVEYENNSSSEEAGKQTDEAAGKNKSPEPYGTTDRESFTRYPRHAEQVRENTTTICEINNTQPYSNAGLTPTQQRTSGTATIIAHQPVTHVWGEFASQAIVQDHFLDAVRTIADRSYDDLETVLNTAGVLDTPMNGHGTRSLFHKIRRRGSEPAAWDLLRVLRELGTGHSTIDDIHAIARLFQFSDPNRADDRAPTVGVELNYDELKDLSRSQRIDVCELLGTLSKAFDIRLECTRLTQAYLRHHHREHLPGVSEWQNTHCIESRVDDALTQLDPDGGPVSILRALNGQPGETLSYHEVYALFETSQSRARQYISSLKEYGLVEPFGSDAAKKLSLLDAGREVLIHMNEHYGRQITLENSVSGTPKSQRQRRVPRDVPDGDRTGPGNNNHNSIATEPSPATPQGSMEQQTATETAEAYRTAYLNRADHEAVEACGVESGTVTVVSDDVSDVDGNTRFVSFDEERCEAVVSVHATNPLDYTTSLAVALASPAFVDEVLDEMTLEAVFDEVPTEILRNGRQVGYLTEDVLADPGAFRNTVVQWAEDIEEMTQQFHNKEYDDRDEFLSDILRESHGLAGSVVHLLDAAGIDLVRDIRVPGKTNTEKLEALAESIAHTVFIQSRYQARVAYRELFEDRAEKRESKLGVEVDALDPYGSLIGSFVVRGGGAERVTGALGDELDAYEPHEDAAEFSVPVPIRGVSRETVATTAARVLSPKNLRVTRDIVSILNAVVDSPFDVARALQQLAAEPESREIDAAELRYVLRQLTSDDVLSELPKSVAEIVMVLVDADCVLSQSEVAERADQSTQTVRNHADKLEATGLVRRGPNGWRFEITFRGERGSNRVPKTCSQSVDSVVDGVVDAVGEECSCGEGCVDAVRCGRYAGVCITGRWCVVGVRLCGWNVETDNEREVMIGEEPSQESIVDFIEDGDETGSSQDSHDGNSERDVDDSEDVSVTVEDFSDVSIAGAVYGD